MPDIASCLTLYRHLVMVHIFCDLRGINMDYDKELVARKLRRWEKFLTNYTLPSWEELPSLDLYMDQVIVLLSQHLNFLPKEEHNDKIITASIINNYVRMHIIPPPVKKKYSKIHMAYLIMICTLKQSLNIAYVQNIIPIGLEEEEVKTIYNGFVEKHRDISAAFVSSIRASAADILDNDNHDPMTVNSFVIETAIISNLYKLLTEKVVNLKNRPEPKPKTEDEKK